VNIIYIALTADHRRLVIDCATLDEALTLAATHLAQDVLPVSISIEGHHFDIDMIVALLDQRRERQCGA
jgi:hypothetical protein